MDQREICQKVIELNGTDNQLFKAAEELGELIQAIGAFKTKCTTLKDFLHLRNQVIEEITDVKVILMQLELMLQVSKAEGEEMLNYKLDRIRKDVLHE